ncbi:sensor histidine kinase [Nakamurella aerolata]|uniref:Two-component system sensor histidine kinase DesK n=1 Tax=Nakamurella aerolata TaxID=1656892 RepID=A0A849A7U2_9ACTN|nr:histidine kinase [Nakamurella aerolata]NNG36619.1 hypothetical protein [Nakamurella aerolata]
MKTAEVVRRALTGWRAMLGTAAGRRPAAWVPAPQLRQRSDARETSGAVSGETPAGSDSRSGAHPGGDPGGGSTRHTDRSGLLISLFWSCIWLFWLVQPVASLWFHRSFAAALTGSVLVALFGALYVAHLVLQRAVMVRVRWPLRTWPNVAGLARFAALGAVAAGLVLVAGQDGFPAVFFVAISAVWTLPLWAAGCCAAMAGAGYWILQLHVSGWVEDTGSLFGLGFGFLGALLGISGARRQRELQRERERNAQLMVADERARFARDLHDLLGHSLTVMTVKAELAGRLFDLDPAAARREVGDLERLSRQALSDVRGAVEGYREISLNTELIGARNALDAAGIRAELPSALGDVPDDLRELFAWTVREAITNVLRHSAATRCSIRITETAITVRDNGFGAADANAGVFADAAAGRSDTAAAGAADGGHGLRSLRERAAAVGATVVTRRLRPGFELTVTVLPTTGPPADPAAAAPLTGRPAEPPVETPVTAAVEPSGEPFGGALAPLVAVPAVRGRTPRAATASTGQGTPARQPVSDRAADRGAGGGAR